MAVIRIVLNDSWGITTIEGSANTKKDRNFIKSHNNSNCLTDEVLNYIVKEGYTTFYGRDNGTNSEILLVKDNSKA